MTSVAPGTPLAPGHRRTAGWLFLFLLATYTALMSGHFYTPDEYYKLKLATRLIERRDFRVEPGATAHTNEHGYASFPIGQTLLYLPLELAARGSRRLVPQAGEFLGELLCAWTSSLFTALLVTWIFLLVVEEGFSRSTGVVCALGAAFATYLWPYARYSFGEPVALFCLLFALREIRRRSRVPHPGGVALAVAGLVFGLGCTVRIESVVTAPVLLAAGLAGDLRRKTRLRAVLWHWGLFAAATSAAFSLNLAYNHIRYASVLDFGHARLSVDVPGTLQETQLHRRGPRGGRAVLRHRPPTVAQARAGQRLLVALLQDYPPEAVRRAGLERIVLYRALTLDGAPSLAVADPAGRTIYLDLEAPLPALPEAFHRALYALFAARMPELPGDPQLFASLVRQDQALLAALARDPALAARAARLKAALAAFCPQLDEGYWQAQARRRRTPYPQR